MAVTAVILAAGRGERMQARDNKVFLPLVGTPVLAYSVRAFAAVDAVREIVIVTRAGEEEQATRIVAPLFAAVKIVHGGARRQDSARAGVAAASGEIVLIHDAARPFPSSELIARVIATTIRHGACVPVIPVADTLRYTNQDGFLLPRTIARAGLYRMQTPQGFMRDRILSVLSGMNESITDDAAAVLAMGGMVSTTPGEETNIKLTTKADLLLAAALITAGIVARGGSTG